MSKPVYPQIKWPQTGTTSGYFTTDGNQVVGFITPATIASTSITFNAAISTQIQPITWFPVENSASSSITFTTKAATAQYIAFNADQVNQFSGVEAVQMVASSSEVANSAFRLVLIPRQY